MPRLFIGIKLNDPKNIINYQKKLQRSLSKSVIHWVESDNYHLTIKFLGEVESHFIKPIIQILEHLSQKSELFTLHSGGIGIFGSIQKPHVIWFGFKENPLLSSLQARIEKSLNEIGFNMGEKHFSPHITIGRVKSFTEEKKLSELLQVKDQINDCFEIVEFQLMQSILKREGPVHTMIKSFRLAEPHE